MRERYVLLGLARARADWFRTIGQWSTAAMLPADFVRCVSVEELRTRIGSGRAFSAVVVDGSVPGIDRDLIAAANEAGVTVLVVDDDARRDWRALGAGAVLASRFSRDELMEVLAATSTAVSTATYDPAPDEQPSGTERGRLVAVTGPGGTGASTLAIALAQGFAQGEGQLSSSDRISRPRADPSTAPSTLLVDLCRTADQAMLHDSRVVVPGIQEIVEAHRTAVPARSTLLEQTFEVPDRGYRLVLGLRRSRHWVALRPRALDSALDSLQRLATIMVADVEADLEGEAETGSVDVEDRNLLARATIARADAVMVVGEPSMKGLFALVRTINELVGFGVATGRILPVINRSSWRPRARAELTTAVADLVGSSLGTAAKGALNPIHVPERSVDEALRDGVALPGSLARPLARAMAGVLARVDGPSPSSGPPSVQVAPGSLSAFTSQERPN